MINKSKEEVKRPIYNYNKPRFGSLVVVLFLLTFYAPSISVKMASNIPFPARMDVSDRDSIAANWKMFRKEWDDYEIASESSQKDEKVRVATLRIVMGRECVAILDNLDLTAAQVKKVTCILDALQANFEPQRNVIYERSLFYSASQLSGESINQYINKLRRLASSCEFTPIRVHEESIRDKLALGVRDKQLKKQLLSDSKLTLVSAITKCKAAEQSDVEMANLYDDQATEAVNYANPTTQGRKKMQPSWPTGKPSIKECKFCGGKHVWDKFKCPAFGKTCKKCNKPNHFAKVCTFAVKTKVVHAVEMDPEQGDSSDESAF